MPSSPLLSLHTHNNNNNNSPCSSSLALSISSHQQKMSDFGASISLSRDLSDSSSSDQTPLSPTPLSSGGALLTNNTVVDDDNDHHIHYPNNQQLMLTTPTQRKPRGRPPGSKNKPKPPVIITRDSELAMKPVVLDIPVGCCIIDRILTFGRRNHVGVSVMGASGSVVGVTLRQPTPHAPLVSLPGPFTILSLHGTFVGGGVAATAAPVARGNSSVPGSANPNPGLVYSCPSFGIVFAGTQGQVFGGIVAGRLVAASHVSVMVSTFASPAFHRMGSEDADQDGGGAGGGGSGGVGGSEGFGGGSGVSTGMTMGMGVYGCGGTPISVQMTRTHDVMQWASTHAPPAAY